MAASARDALDPNLQLRWAIEHLPRASETTDAAVSVEAPSLEGPSEATVRVPFVRAARDRGGRRVDGWAFEGDVRIAATDLDVSSGFPGVHAWVLGKLGPCCLELDASEPAGGVAHVRLFATTSDQL